jgi:DNA-nicking Smr family endonuclease
MTDNPSDGDRPVDPRDSDADEMLPEEIVVPIEERIDLHPFSPREVRSVVEAYLDAAIEEGFAEVRLIHGRGIGVQREIVRSFLAGHPGVIDYGDAPPDRGGWGATIVRLRTGEQHPRSSGEPIGPSAD